MGSPAYFGKFVNFTAASRKNALIPFGTFSPSDNLTFIAEIPGPVTPAVVPTPVTFSATPVIDTSLGSVFTLFLTADVTSMALNFNGGQTIPDGTPVSLRITQNATGGHACALPANLAIDVGFAVDPGPRRTTVLPIRWNNTNSKWIFTGIPFSILGA